MSYRPHPRLTDTNPDRPRAWATCDRCGFITSHYKMTWDKQWAGAQIINKGFLVCELCIDVPQQQLRTLILPADPAPIFNARPEPYTIDETDWLTTGVRSNNPNNDILETQDDELLVTQPSATEAETESTN